MSKKDIEEKDYFNDELHFADLCNGILFHGTRNILPEDLEESDTELIYPDKKMFEIKRYVNNYKLNLFDYHDYDDFSVFKTEVRVIFESLKTAGEMEQMKKLFQKVKKIGLDTVGLLESLLNIRIDRKYIIKEDDGKEYIEVCKAWEDNWKDGQENGISIGMAQGVEQGIEQTIFRLVYKKVKKNYTLDMIADDLEEDVEVIRPIYEKAKKQLS